MSAALSTDRAWGPLFGAGLVAVASALLLLGASGCNRRAPTEPAAAPRPTVASATTQTSGTCRECHEPVFVAWSGSDHALANRMIDPAREGPALATFAPPPGVGSGAAPVARLGNKPLWQPLIPAPGGRWQPHELAFDPAKGDWFNVFGNEQRQPGEWGHWTGRGMNWNSMCAQCHMTGYQKNYDAPQDAYRSTWVEHGVGCIQCHGPTKPGHGAKDAPKVVSPAPFHGDRAKMMQTCAPCHARGEQLTLDFQPGDSYHDHYRVTLPVEPGIYYPDGQQRDEDFNWTSVLLSRMGHAGVTCLDCHDPHTGKTIIPASNNVLCLQCHGAPGRVMASGIRALPIDPLPHSHHAEGSTGNSCVACHMPTTNYMERAPRHDHGWLKPDPLLTKELGIPNACSKCHQDKTVDWAITSADQWYGARLNSPQRARARAVAEAQAGKATAVAALLPLFPTETVPAWRATFLSLLAPWSAQPEVQAAARASLAAVDPVERAAAVRLVATSPQAAELLPPFLKDPVRLVRVDAEWALSTSLPADSPTRRELDAYLSLSIDQPVGRLRYGQDMANRGQLAAAEREIALATEWDPNSAGIFEVHGMVLAGLNRLSEAAAKLRRASDLSPTDGQRALQAGLAYAEAGVLTEAEKMFQTAVQRDPQFHRAWYNLGLLFAQSNRLPAAVTALRQAETVAPTAADYPYALATVLLRTGDAVGAKAAAERTLRLDPAHQAARQLLRAVP